MVTRIGIVAPSVYIMPDTKERIEALAAAEFPEAQLVWHPQVFARSPNEVAGNTGFVFSNEEVIPDNTQYGHFAGSDEQRAAAFVEFANRDDLDAIWFAAGGYGAGRIALDVLPRLNASARNKTYMGFSDASYTLAMLYRAGFPHVCHGPMAVSGNESARRALAWLTRRDPSALEPSIRPGQKYAAFNLISLAMIVGTPLMPDLSDHVVMVEEVGEYLYAVDRCFFSICLGMMRSRPAEIKLGSITNIKENNRPFGKDEVGIAEDWCRRTNIPYGGRARIGHDADNHVVPFGLFRGA